jgi:hypothetical protein
MLSKPRPLAAGTHTRASSVSQRIVKASESLLVLLHFEPTTLNKAKTSRISGGHIRKKNGPRP